MKEIHPLPRLSWKLERLKLKSLLKWINRINKCIMNLIKLRESKKVGSSSVGCVCVGKRESKRVKLNFKQIRCNASNYAKNEDLCVCVYIYTYTCVKGVIMKFCTWISYFHRMLKIISLFLFTNYFFFFNVATLLKYLIN